MWRSPQLSALLRCSFAHGAPQPGGVIHTPRPGLVGSHPFKWPRLTELQTYQAMALKQLYEGSSDPGLMQELRTATDLALWATKVTARPLGQTMSTLVVQERHLWLNLADMSESDKHRFLDSPISQAGLFGDTVESFAQQFSITQKRTRQSDILPRRPAAVVTPPPAVAPPPARHRGRPPSAEGAPFPGSRKVAQPVSAPARPVKCQGKRRSWDRRTRDTGPCSSGDGESTPSPGGGPGGKSFFSFLGSPASGTQTSEQFPMSPVPKEGKMAVHGTQSRHPRLPLLPLLSPVGSRIRSEDVMPFFAPPAQPWSQVSVALRTQTPLRDALPSESGPCAPLRCPTAGTSVVPLGPLVQSLGAWLVLPRPSRWLMNHQTRLCDSPGILPSTRSSSSSTSADWGFGSTGKRANSPLCRGSLFSAWSWTRSTSQHVSQ